MKLQKVIVLMLLFSSISSLNLSAQQCYSDDYVEISSVKFKNENYTVVTMLRDGERIKAKYFAAKDYNGNSVYNRYLEWKKSHSKVILLSSGTYMDSYGNPQGLTIDNGQIVNQSLIQDRMDALVIVYATGGVVVSNLKDGDLRIKINGVDRVLDLRRSAGDLDDFIQWAEDQQATVFQTHLLVYKNQIKIDPNTSSRTSRERRFLAVGKNEEGKIVHAIVHCPQYSSLYDGTEKTLDFLETAKQMSITFMINLDTGAQDVFELHNSNCSPNQAIKGQLEPSKAVNLLAYYFN